VSLCGFGGGLVWARRIVVERQQWMDEQEFAETLTLCQFMPGPNIVGITVCVGSKLRGWVGAVTAVGRFILIPWTIGLSLGLYTFSMLTLRFFRTSSAGFPPPQDC